MATTRNTCPINAQLLNMYTLTPHGAQDVHKLPIIHIKRVPHKIRHRTMPSCAVMTFPTRLGQRLVKIMPGAQMLPRCERIAIISRGYIPIANPRRGTPRYGGAIERICYLMRRNILDAVDWVAFDYLDNASYANFGQEFDRTCLKYVIDEVLRKNPQARLTLVGDCRGARAILNYLAMYDNAMVDTIILESPLTSIEATISTMADNFIQSFVGKQRARSYCSSLFSWFFPSYDRNKQELEHLDRIRGKRILIGHYLNDAIIPSQQVTKLVRTLRDQNEVYYFTTADDKADHSCISNINSFSYVVNAFLDAQAIACNPQYAMRGTQMLANTQRQALVCA